MWTGLTFSQDAPRRPALYVASSPLTTTPSCPRSRVQGEELLRLPGVLGARHQRAPYPQGLGDQPGQLRVPFGQRQVEQVAAVDGQRVEEHRRDGDRPRRRGHVGTGAHPSGGLLEGAGTPVRVQRDGLAVQDEPLARQRQGRLGDLGEPVGDVVQGGVDPYGAAVPVHLDADAVQLLLHGRGAQLADRLGDRGRAVRQHRQHGPADGEPEPVQGAGTVRQQGLRHRLERTREHHRAPYVRRGNVRRRGQALDGGRVQGALADLPGEQPGQEALLVLRGRAHQLADQPGPLGLRTGAGDRAEPGEPGVRVPHGQRRGIGRRDRAAQHLPADADPALREPSGQIRDDDRHVCRLRLAEQLREQDGLAGPRRRGGDLPGHLGQPGKQHAVMVHRGRLAHTPRLPRDPAGAASPASRHRRAPSPGARGGPHPAMAASSPDMIRSPTIAAAAR
ncbi:hypothetical protein SVIOM342S_00311 [Streptomyces violaceorubidus]